jgi:hypothetical protein
LVQGMFKAAEIKWWKMINVIRSIYVSLMVVVGTIYCNCIQQWKCENNQPKNIYFDIFVVSEVALLLVNNAVSFGDGLQLFPTKVSS